MSDGRRDGAGEIKRRILGSVRVCVRGKGRETKQYEYTFSFLCTSTEQLLSYWLIYKTAAQVLVILRAFMIKNNLISECSVPSTALFTSLQEGQCKLYMLLQIT